MLADEACSHASVPRSAFVRNLKTELSVATVKGNALVFQSCICQMARKAGKAFRKWATCPTRIRCNKKAYCHIGASGHVTAHHHSTPTIQEGTHAHCFQSSIEGAAICSLRCGNNSPEQQAGGAGDNLQPPCEYGGKAAAEDLPIQLRPSYDLSLIHI